MEWGWRCVSVGIDVSVCITMLSLAPKNYVSIYTVPYLSDVFAAQWDTRWFWLAESHVNVFLTPAVCPPPRV